VADEFDATVDSYRGSLLCLIGTGLGLAISQLLARQIGASLALVETKGDGTTFRLTLSL